MDLNINLRQVIEQYVHLTSTTSTGWHPVVCKLCHDHGKKGPRAGFRFDENIVVYNCFNCGHSAEYNPQKTGQLSPKMIAVLRSFLIPEEEYQKVIFADLNRSHNSTHAPHSTTVRPYEPTKISIPKNFYYLKEATNADKWAEVAKLYLESRAIVPDTYPFMLARNDANPPSKWYKRVIMPIFKDDNIIFFHGRDLTGTAKRKYESTSTGRDCVIYGFDKLFKTPQLPLIIVEGWFDAFVIDGIAILGNKITEGQVHWLNKSPRRKIYVPDRTGNGHFGAKQALRHGWHISTPDIGNCKDINSAVQTYGKIYVVQSIIEHAAIGFEATTKLGIFCK